MHFLLVMLLLGFFLEQRHQYQVLQLGYKKELDAVEDPQERGQLFERLLAEAYEKGKATEAATKLEIDAVIDPIDTRATILRALAAAAP